MTVSAERRVQAQRQLADRREHPAVVHHLVGEELLAGALDLSRDRQHRHPVQGGRGHAVQHRGRARSQGGQADPGLSRPPGMNAAGHPQGTSRPAAGAHDREDSRVADLRHRPIVTQGAGAWTSAVRYEQGAAGRVCTAFATYGEIIAAYGCGLAAGRTAARDRHRGSDRIPVRARAAGRRPAAGGGRAGAVPPTRARSWSKASWPSVSRRCPRRCSTRAPRASSRSPRGGCRRPTRPRPGELEDRRAAVEHLVEPLRETLARVEDAAPGVRQGQGPVARRAGRAGQLRPGAARSSSGRRRRPWSPRCAGPRRGAAGASCSCAGWSSWPG